MANQKLVKLLRKGVPGFNAWRAANPNELIDLIGADLYRAKLFGANLSGANLSGAYLVLANLRWAKLFGANLSGAKLTAAYLYMADLTGAYLTGADLYVVDLTGADLSGVKGLTAEQLVQACFIRASGIPHGMVEEIIYLVRNSLLPSNVPAA